MWYHDPVAATHFWCIVDPPGGFNKLRGGWLLPGIMPLLACKLGFLDPVDRVQIPVGHVLYPRDPQTPRFDSLGV